MLFTNIQKTVRTLVDLRVGEKTVEQVTQCKLLGVTFHSHLKWNIHYQGLARSLNTVNFKLRALRDVVEFDVLRTVYFTEFQSRISYGILLWGNKPPQSEIFLTQKRAIRTLAGVSGTTSCRPLFVKYKILTLTSLFIYHTAIFVHQNKFAFVRENNSVHSYNIRQQTIHQPSHRLAVTGNSPFYCGIKIFNHLPNDLKVLQLNHFKIKLKKLLLEKCYYSMSEFFQDQLM